jgi:STE24 endopeptidase
MLETLIILYTLYIALKVYISVMQIGFIQDEKIGMPVLMNPSEYLHAGSYAVAKERIGLVETMVEWLLFLWWVLGGFAWLQGALLMQSEMMQAMGILLAFFLINWLAGLPFEGYRKFVLDARFGFNQSTLRLFVLDTLKSLLLSVLIGGPLLFLLVWIVLNVPMWWFWGFLLVFIFAVGANLLMPYLMGFFNTFSPLQEGELRQRIIAMMQSAGLRSEGVFVMDASKRDNRLNAFFGGLGRSKRVVLFDTLIAKLSTDELLAVLGHELGHFRHGDIWKNIGMIALLLFAVFALLGNLPERLFLEIGVVPGAGVMIAMIALLLPLAGFLFTPVMSALSRHNEYAADAFGSKVGGREHLISALLKLVTENKAFPKSHPLVIFFYHTHPPVLERLKALGYRV